MTQYVFGKPVAMAFDQAVQRITETEAIKEIVAALKNCGFNARAPE